MPQHKAVYYPEKQDTILDQIDYDIMRDDEMAQVNMDIKHLDFRDTLLYHMRQMNIKQSELVILCEEVISDRTVQRMLTADSSVRTKPNRENVILICLALQLPYPLSMNLIGKAGYSFLDGMTGQRLQKLLQYKLAPQNAQRTIKAILKEKTS